ncbi:MAG: phospholipid-binding protein MlaC [Rickettsiaceae bacterium]
MKIINIILLSIFVYIAPVNAQDDVEKLKVYVDNLITQGYDIVNDPTLTEDQKITRSSALISANLYLDWMAQYSLGRNKRSLSTQKMQEFTEVYSKFVVRAYAELSKNYSGVKAAIKKVTKVTDNAFIINMEILTTGSDIPVKVDYLVHKLTKTKQTSYKVGDIITEGVSILNSQQSEFNSIISNQGIDALIDNLKEKLSKKN